MSGSRKHVVTLVRQDLVVPVATGTIVTYHGVKLGSLSLASFTDGSGAELKAQVREGAPPGRARADPRPARQPRRPAQRSRQRRHDLHPRRHDRLDRRARAAAPGVRGQGRRDRHEHPDGRARRPRHRVGGRDRHGRAARPRAGQGVGTHTYGKGVFQEIEPLPNGGALDFTVGEYFTPSGHNLGGGGVKEGAGITPDISASTSPGAKVDTRVRRRGEDRGRRSAVSAARGVSTGGGTRRAECARQRRRWLARGRARAPRASSWSPSRSSVPAPRWWSAATGERRSAI